MTAPTAGSGTDTPARGRTAPARRERPLALAFRLYRQDPTFRGLLEFAVIGAIVLFFLHPPLVAWAPMPSHMFGTQQPAAPPPPGIADMPQSLGALIAHAGEGLFTAIPNTRMMPIDVGLFATSTPAVRNALLAAAHAYETHDVKAALAALDGVDQDDPNVMLLRGLSLIASKGQANGDAGTELLQKATARGQRQAAAFLGLLLIAAPGLKKDSTGGWRLLHQAADAGDAGAELVLGCAYYTGAFAVIDPYRAAHYMRLAADAGNASAKFRLAYFAQGGIGMAKDEAAVEPLVIAAAEGGMVEAQVMLGLYYELQYASGWIADPSAAIHWLGRAADAGFPEAMFSLGLFYLTIKEAPWHDERKAAEVFAHCAATLFDACLSAYGSLLEHGIGVDRDVARAYAMYQLVRGPAANNAKKRMAELEAKMTPAQIERARQIAEEAKVATPAARAVTLGLDEEGCSHIAFIRLCPPVPGADLPQWHDLTNDRMKRS
jgi:TPR repeat protein